MNSIFAIIAVLITVYVVKRIRDLVVENRRLERQCDQVARMKKDFISYVSHELKAPLASMQETTQLLLEGIPGPLAPKQRRLLELNLQSGKRLARMIGNVLDISRLEAGIVDYNMQVHELGELVRGFVDEWNARERRSIPLETETPSEPLVISCDAALFAQLLEKIVEHSVMQGFSERGSGRIEVDFVGTFPPHIPERHRRRIESHDGGRNGYALISVFAAGRRIDDSKKEEIFEVFQQSDGTNLGLGLPIARALAEEHKGAVWVEDDPRGAVFRVLLPLVEPYSKRLRQAS